MVLGSRRVWIERGGILVVALVAAAIYLSIYRTHPARPQPEFGAGGWWTWFDQHRYLLSAQAWAGGNLDPKQHWYLPGYPLLGAVFVPWLGPHAFAAVDLLCLVASLWLFSRIAVRLLPDGWPLAGLHGAVAFAVASVGLPALRDVWVVPWSTSGSTPVTYLALLAALRCADAPKALRRGFGLGAAVGAVAAFRPTDIVPIGIACAIPVLAAFVRQRDARRAILRQMGAALLGLGAMVGMVAALYLSANGPWKDTYLSRASDIGFEWRSLGPRWVTLGLSPQPLFDDGAGLISAAPWLPLGLAAFPALLLLPMPSRRRAATGAVAAAVSLHVGMYLTFRDLYPEGLFRYGNYHYYKWAFPLLLLACVALACELAAPRRGRLVSMAVLFAGLAALLPWRAEWTGVVPIAHESLADGRHGVTFQSGLTGVRDAILVPASGGWSAIYEGESSLKIGRRWYTERVDYKLHPMPGGFFLAPLRPLEAGPATLMLDPRLTLDPARQLLHARQSTVFGWPCWWGSNSGTCAAQVVLPPPSLPASGEIAMNQSGDGYRSGAWSAPEPGGCCWTEGAEAAFRLPAPPAGGARLDLSVAAFVPPGADALRVSLAANGHVLAQWRFDDQTRTEKVVTIPPAVVRERATLFIALHISNPRRPSDTMRGALDRRELGLFVSGAKLTAAPSHAACPRLSDGGAQTMPPPAPAWPRVWASAARVQADQRP